MEILPVSVCPASTLIGFDSSAIQTHIFLSFPPVQIIPDGLLGDGGNTQIDETKCE